VQPWIGQAIRGATANIGPAQSYLAMWVGVPLSDWVSAGDFAFRFMQPVLAALIGLLTLIGFASAVMRRKIDQVLWLLTGLFVPILLITALDISRAPPPKYILFVMIVYLVTVAIGLDAMLQAVMRRVETRSPSTAGLMGVSLPLIQAEHVYVDNDWKGIAQYLENSAHDGDAVIPITLDLADGFNQGHVVLSYYLPQIAPGLRLLMGEHLTDPKSAIWQRWPKRAAMCGSLCSIAIDRSDLTIQTLRLYRFRLTFTWCTQDVDRPPLEEMAALYPRVIRQAVTPAVQCYLWRDLATLHVQLRQFDEATITRRMLRSHARIRRTHGRRSIIRYSTTTYRRGRSIERTMWR